MIWTEVQTYQSCGSAEYSSELAVRGAESSQCSPHVTVLVAVCLYVHQYLNCTPVH